jgi:hypothetical protein
VVACGLQHGAVVLDGDVVTWGRAADGRLGQGDIVEVGQSHPFFLLLFFSFLCISFRFVH